MSIAGADEFTSGHAILLSILLSLITFALLWQHLNSGLPPAWKDKLIAAGFLKSSTRCSRLFDTLPVNVLILGIDGAGKSTLQYNFLSQPPIGADVFHTMPMIGTPLGQSTSIATLLNSLTTGLTMEKLVLPSATFTVASFAPSASQQVWQFFLNRWLSTYDAIIWVIDASDRARFGTVRYFLDKLKQSVYLRLDAPILLLANKTDWPYHAKTAEIVESLGLNDLMTIWHCQMCCMQDETGVFEGLQWLVRALRIDSINVHHPEVMREVVDATCQAFG